MDRDVSYFYKLQSSIQPFDAQAKLDNPSSTQMNILRKSIRV